jgi:hypothetical protein
MDDKEAARIIIQTMRAEIERLREGLGIAGSWLERWAAHVADCEGGDRCTCGLTRIRYDVAIALQPK